jgi:hypothetical protein
LLDLVIFTPSTAATIRLLHQLPMQTLKTTRASPKETSQISKSKLLPEPPSVPREFAR